MKVYGRILALHAKVGPVNNIFNVWITAVTKQASMGALHVSMHAVATPTYFARDCSAHIESQGGIKYQQDYTTYGIY